MADAAKQVSEIKLGSSKDEARKPSEPVRISTFQALHHLFAPPSEATQKPQQHEDDPTQVMREAPSKKK